MREPREQQPRVKVKRYEKGMVPSSLEDELKKIIVQVAPVSNTYPIPSESDLSKTIQTTLPYYDYYLVELGLNVLVGKDARIPDLAFEVDLLSNGQQLTDVTAFDIMPKDEIKNIEIIGGKITLGVSKLLNLIPGPIGAILPNLLSIDINPWEFAWNYKEYRIDATGPKNYNVRWHLYGTDVVQGFNPTMILKARKPVSEITAHVQATYDLKTGIMSPGKVSTDKKTVRILPI